MFDEGLQPLSDANTLARMLARSASLLQAHGCGVFIWDEDKDILTAMTPFAGLEPDQVRGLEVPVSASAIGKAILHDRAIMLDELADSQPDVSKLKEFGIRNVLAVPLALERRDEANDVVERSIMGVFVAFDKYYDRSFDQEDVRLLGMMARQVSAVLVTSQLYWKALDRTKKVIATIESMSVGLIAISPNGSVTQCNAAARRALGIEAHGWFGLYYESVIQNDQIRADVAAALAGDPVAHDEISLQLGREERIFRLQSDSIVAENGQSLGWVVVLEDITEIREAERMMATFVDMVSHELRTPLTSIRGFVATLLQAGEGVFDWDTQSEFLQIADVEAERLGQMIDDLLNIARIQNGRGLQLQFTQVNLNAVVEHVVRVNAAHAGKHEIRVDLPPLPPITADEGKVTQILNNLLSNAIKYSPNGGVITISGEPTDGGATIHVTDQGLGIPAEDLPLMFTRFHRVDNQDRVGIKGTGLGLWLIKHLVEGHGGRIWVESVYGKGSTFSFRLPSLPLGQLPLTIG
ncbi:MAG: PAS domain-containing protein [Armatimonadetes bacterium]|nr:PAS domain-containing protein [Armatimonadota bacterium]